MDEEDLFIMFGFLKISKFRASILMALEDDVMMPSELAHMLNLKPAQISNALMDMKGKNLVRCLNEKVNKGRLYTCTDYGRDIMHEYVHYFGYPPEALHVS
ncbi:MarR family transcriptional regulator [uncultured Methanobrevibacter sp.]|uniref:MarR family transcriptional regulator n=1 Tax=uncultured Methanobrevibacter sp. TaxID=253161 RepID=UPI00261D2D17|nr:MarR family transcriptional regulator [uncultured Methanobrevibacter sp.]